MTAVKESSRSTSRSPAAGPAPFPKGVSLPAIRALASIGCTHLGQLVDASEEDLAMLHGMASKALRILGEALKAEGKSFQP